MTNEEFQECLDRYGTNLERWPAERRGPGRACADTSEGRRRLDAARAFDALLAETLAVPEPLGLKARILVHVNAEGRLIDMMSWLFAPLWRPIALAAAPLALGFTLGFTYPETDGLEEAVAIIAFTEIEEVNGTGNEGSF